MHISTETRVGIFVLLAIGVFAYMTFHIGVFRFDRARYSSYSVFFNDVAGLSKKADVKIAGVKVGWVDTLILVDSTQVEAKIMVLKPYDLHSDSYAIVRQDGLLGNKYLEVVPGSPLLPVLPSGSTLTKSSREAVSVDDILHNVKLIAQNVEEVTDSLRSVLGGQHGVVRLENTIDNISQAAERFASFADSVNRFMNDNQEHLNIIMSDARDITHKLRDAVPTISDDMHGIFGQISRDVLPEIQGSARKISDAVDRDFNRIAGKVEVAA
ncbi:MAG: MlaD family protein, partial [Bacteroidota bacterium]